MTAYPRILQDDYEAFRKILPEQLPEKYNKWVLNLHKRINRERFEYEKTNAPKLFKWRFVRINSGQFTNYCKEKSEEPSIHLLFQFANESTQ
jgi:hypothetical protein